MMPNDGNDSEWSEVGASERRSSLIQRHHSAMLVTRQENSEERSRLVDKSSPTSLREKYRVCAGIRQESQYSKLLCKILLTVHWINYFNTATLGECCENPQLLVNL